MEDGNKRYNDGEVREYIYLYASAGIVQIQAVYDSLGIDISEETLEWEIARRRGKPYTRTYLRALIRRYKQTIQEAWHWQTTWEEIE